MVPIMKAKNKKIPFVQIDYLIHIQEIKPWPPSQSLRTLRSVLIQWEHGDRNSGVTAQVVPSVGSGVGDGRIEFNESFKLSGKNGDKNSSQKNCIEFSLIEPRRDKTVKGQVLGTAIIDLADYGVLKEDLCISVAINCKRSYRNTSQPFLLLKIESIDRNRANISSIKKNGGDSVSVLMSEEYAEEAEIASFTDDDDDVNSNSSPPPTSSLPVETNGGSPVQNTTVKSENVEAGSKGSEEISVTLSHDYSKSELALSTASSNGCSSRNSSTDLSSWFANSDTIIVPNDQEPDEIQRDVSPDVNNTEKFDSVDSFYSSINGTASSSNLIENDLVNGRFDKCQENIEDSEIVKESDQCPEEQPKISYSEHDTWMDVPLRGALISPNGDDDNNNNKHVHVRSVRSSLKSSRSGHSMNYDHIKETRNVFSDSKMEHLEQKLKKLEWELTEAAAMEASLYSIVAEHGSSANKVHAPARFLSRFYIHAAKENSQSARRTSAAKSCVSGLILVAKACGNDVPRLTFWLSNTIILRTIITESFGEEPKMGKKKTFPLKWQFLSSESFDDWEDPWTLENALEKVEEWIATQIIESLWWQTLTPHMQSGARKAIKMSSDQEQVIFSLKLWKKAFMDAYARICPVRSEGHECGCLPALSPMIIDQCVSRLDVAMLNAILRESGDDHIPTDPVSDPVSDAQVLPIPAGKASFGAGAQLKNAIGNWTRWLDDLLGHKTNTHRTPLKSFHLLNELSDLMMLPKDMLLSKTIRKEVCPTFGPTLIRRVLNIFVPDEFCPDPIPKIVLEALNSEDSFDDEENAVINYPYPAARIEYIPPLTSDIVRMLRDGSLLVTISHTSDDELDMLDSPLSCIHKDITTNHNTHRKKYVLKSEENANHDSMRYQFLRKIWNSSN